MFPCISAHISYPQPTVFSSVGFAILISVVCYREYQSHSGQNPKIRSENSDHKFISTDLLPCERSYFCSRDEHPPKLYAKEDDLGLNSEAIPAIIFSSKTESTIK